MIQGKIFGQNCGGAIQLQLLIWKTENSKKKKNGKEKEYNKYRMMHIQILTPDAIFMHTFHSDLSSLPPTPSHSSSHCVCSDLLPYLFPFINNPFSQSPSCSSHWAATAIPTYDFLLGQTPTASCRAFRQVLRQHPLCIWVWVCATTFLLINHHDVIFMWLTLY